jgi:hypothetical protein
MSRPGAACFLSSQSNFNSSPFPSRVVEEKIRQSNYRHFSKQAGWEGRKNNLIMAFFLSNKKVIGSDMTATRRGFPVAFYSLFTRL